jgi:hypothetical protein
VVQVGSHTVRFSVATVRIIIIIIIIIIIAATTIKTSDQCGSIEMCTVSYLLGGKVAGA